MESDSSYYYSDSDEECADTLYFMIKDILTSIIDTVEADIVQGNMARILQEKEMQRRLPPYIPPSMRPHMDQNAYEGMLGRAKRTLE